MVKTSKRFKRYKAKFDPETIGRLFSLTKDLSLEEEAKYQPLLHNINMKVKQILASKGVSPIFHHYYTYVAYDFLNLKLRKFERETAPDLEAIYLYWCYKGLNEEIIKEIALLFNYKVGVITKQDFKEALETALTLKSPEVTTNPLQKEFEYDAEGKITKITITDLTTGKKKIKHFTYDAEGNIIDIREEVTN